MVHVVAQLIHRLPHSHDTPTFFIYIPPLHTRCVCAHTVGLGGSQPPHGETGADFVVIENVPVNPPTLSVAEVVELYEEEEIRYIFILSPLWTIAAIVCNAQELRLYDHHWIVMVAQVFRPVKVISLEKYQVESSLLVCAVNENRSG